MQIVFDATSLNFWGELNPELLTIPGKMVGGTEANMMYMAKYLALEGNDVVFFRQSNIQKREEYDGVSYMPHTTMFEYITDPTSDIDVIITASTGARQLYGIKEIQAKLKVDYVSCTTLYATPEHVANTDLFLCLSPWQKDKLVAQGIPDDKLALIPMGYEASYYPYKYYRPSRSNKIIYTSSPDRGLHHFLEIYKVLLARGVDVSADVYYNVPDWIGRFRYDMNAQGYRVNQVLKNINMPGLTFKGATCHSEVVKACQLVTALVYPCDCIEPGETQIISVLEALAGGTPCILSDHDCIPSLYAGSAYILDSLDYEAWADAVEKVISDETYWYDLHNRGYIYAEDKSWDKVADRLQFLFKSNI